MLSEDFILCKAGSVSYTAYLNTIKGVVDIIFEYGTRGKTQLVLVYVTRKPGALS